MITCHCNIITEREIVEAIEGLLDDDCWQLIVPIKVYRALEKRGKCCRCFPNVVDIIIRTTEEYHARMSHGGGADLLVFREKLMQLRNHYVGGMDERQRKGNRAA